MDGFIDIKTSFDEEYYSRKLYFVKSSYHKYDIWYQWRVLMCV